MAIPIRDAETLATTWLVGDAEKFAANGNWHRATLAFAIEAQFRHLITGRVPF